ncbi:NADP-dependent oxidoreductase [Nocardia sp. NPDC050710]|uniref:NADP-dependent oxidoreductase n=1 Tax=Nocardia sp. NPDC050710 TaxID=3157220 RepID=UPI0033D9271B
MKAVQIRAYGGRAEVADIDDPAVGPREVLLRVSGVALNPLDLKIASGAVRGFFPVQFPYTLGTDVSGTIAEVGAEVAGWSVGDRVVARLDPTRGCAAAEFATVPADQLAKAPASVSLPLSAGIVTAAGTAWQALTEVASLGAGQTVLVHGGAGGVGGFAVQFARDIGARVIATASGDGVDIALKLGAHEVVDYKTADFTESISGVDVVLDTVGGENEARSLEALRPGGLLLALPVPPDVERAVARGLRAEFVFHTSAAGRLAAVVQKIDDGAHILLDRILPLTATPDAMNHLRDGTAAGKVILVADKIV